MDRGTRGAQLFGPVWQYLAMAARRLRAVRRLTASAASFKRAGAIGRTSAHREWAALRPARVETTRDLFARQQRQPDASKATHVIKCEPLGERAFALSRH